MLKKQQILPKMTAIIEFSGIAFVILVLAWLLLWVSFGDSIAYLGYINAAGLVFAVGVIISSIFLLFRRYWLWAILGIGLSAFFLLYPSGTNFAAQEQKLRASDIRIMSASLRGLNRDMAGTAEHLAQYEADIIGLQEVYDINAFKTALEQKTGKTWHAVSGGALAVLSVYPITIDSARESQILSTQINMPERSLSIWTLRAPKAYDRPLTNQQFYYELQRNIVRAKPDAVIGDFNSSPWNEGYGIMDKVMTNAQKSAGLGAGSSFPGPARRSGIAGAFARIDHIFVKQQLAIKNAFTGRAFYKSDHHPVIADIRIK
jgi:endonuclease/exonuclease/phosphatase (EEP) superfamily protein YafD